MLIGPVIFTIKAYGEQSEKELRALLKKLKIEPETFVVRERGLGGWKHEIAVHSEFTLEELIAIRDGLKDSKNLYFFSPF